MDYNLGIGGNRSYFNFWDPPTKRAPPSPDDGDATLYSNPAYYDPDNSVSVKPKHGTGKSLHYDVCSVLDPLSEADGHYEVMDFDTRYETASNFQLELPALPYEVPTPSVSYEIAKKVFSSYEIFWP